VTPPEADGFQRIEELAEDSGTTVRNIRVYQERGLLPAPVRRGRTAFYGPDHKNRLNQILRLLDRGYTFATIEELFIAERHGFTLSELLNSDAVLPERRSSGTRRRLPRGGVEAVAGFEFAEELLDGLADGGVAVVVPADLLNPPALFNAQRIRVILHSASGVAHFSGPPNLVIAGGSVIAHRFFPRGVYRPAWACTGIGAFERDDGPTRAREIDDQAALPSEWKRQ